MHRLRGTLVGEKRAANASEREVYGWKVDCDFIREAAGIVTVLTRHDRHRITAAWTKRASPHDCAGTIGSTLGDVNGHQGVPALWRDDAVA
jgi:hypothetical protein